MRVDQTAPPSIVVQFQRVAAKARIAKRIVTALILREIMTRFGREHMGFIWLVLEPMILTTGVMIGWSIYMGSTKHGVSVVQFVLTGYSGLVLWRHIVLRMINCYRHNAALLFHRNVRPMDTIFARFFLETVGTLISFSVSFVILYLLGLIDPIYDLSLAMAGWISIATFGFAVGLVLSALCEFSEIVEKFVQPIMYVSIPLLGVFTLTAWLPQEAQYVLLHSPMVNGVEMFRAGVIGPKIETHYDGTFIAIANLMTAAVGFTLMQIAEKRIRID